MMFYVSNDCRWHLEKAKTKVFILENVVTGSVHECSSEVLSKGGICALRVLHTQPSDTGHGAVRRFRGWSRA